jgi:drug/metabolite transporter (DMT)-like permease
MSAEGFSLDLPSFIFPIITALLWGITNPLLKRYSAGFASVDGGRGAGGSEIAFLLRRPKYLLVQVLNLLGSVVFFWGLREGDVSSASIIANSLAFAITVVVSSVFMGEEPLSGRSAVGAGLVVAGVSICVYAKGS